MGKLFSESINNFNLKDKFNEMKKLSEYQDLTDSELAQIIIEKSLDYEQSSSEEREFTDNQPTRELNFDLLPSMKEQILGFEGEISKCNSTPYNQINDAVKELFNNLEELGISLESINGKSIFSIKSIKKLYKSFIEGYYEARYSKLLRFFIDLFGFTDTFIHKIPALEKWEIKNTNFMESFIPYNLCSTQLYKNYIKKDETTKNENGVITIMETISTLTENVKSILIRYSVVQSNIEYLNKLGISTFGDDYYHSLLACVGSCVQLYKLFTTISNLSEVESAKNKIKVDHIIPLLHWVRDVWKTRFDGALMNNRSDRYDNIDVLHFICIISGDIYNKLPEEANLLREIVESIPEVVEKIRKSVEILLRNVTYIETTVFLLYLKDYLKNNNIEADFVQAQNEIQVANFRKRSSK